VGNVITDNTPQSVAAGVIYFVAQMCELNITKSDIRQICKVSEVTINKCFKKMYAIKDALIPKAVLLKYGVAEENVA
jgi:transcription initiation factor TFIIIB Brf1 subunit/transcription initiation factor TFIIB